MSGIGSPLRGWLLLAAIADRPGDYVAITGEALLALTQSREPEALDMLAERAATSYRLTAKIRR